MKPRTPEQQAVMNEWLRRLRSGERQGQGFLRRNTKTSIGVVTFWCCLGLLCDVVDPKKWENVSDDDDVVFHTGFETMPDDLVLAAVGIDRDEAIALASRNDQGWSFNTIADLIESDEIDDDWDLDSVTGAQPPPGSIEG